jgi:uracil phosphoribosyltransferase
MLKVNNLSSQNSMVHQILKELRDKAIQTDRNRFRQNIERLGFITAYEISKELVYTRTETETPLGMANTNELEQQPVIATVLRAGLPLQHGVNQLFNQADLAYISAYRHHVTPKDFVIKVEYVACPSLDGRTLILTDPMLATGQSLVMTYEQFLQYGKPKDVHLVSVIGSQRGVEYVKKHIPNATLWIGTIDDTLDDHGYIVPGLGDAGDLSFGEKIQQ